MRSSNGGPLRVASTLLVSTLVACGVSACAEDGSRVADGCGKTGRFDLMQRARTLADEIPRVVVGEYSAGGCDSGDVGSVSFAFQGRLADLAEQLVSGGKCELVSKRDGAYDCRARYGVVVEVYEDSESGGAGGDIYAGGSGR